MYNLYEGLLSFHMMIQIDASDNPCTNGTYEHYNAINMIQIDALAYPCTNGAYGHYYKAITFRMLLTLP